jgi:hypothetical protein
MFTWLNKQGVRSDRGFAVQRTGRFTAEYRDKGRVVSLDVEDGTLNGQPCIIVDPDAFQEWDGETAKVRPEEEVQWFQNLREAMEFQGLKLAIERGVEPDERGMLPLRRVDD